MKDLGKIHQEAKRYYIKASLEHTQDEDMKKAVQSLGITLLYFENSLDNDFIVRDTRNFIYDLEKEMLNKPSKKLLKGLLKIIK
jgi:spore germination protein GerM